jgi:hypothetical protein
MLGWGRRLFKRAKDTVVSKYQAARDSVRRAGRLCRDALIRLIYEQELRKLAYFEEVLAVELGAINARRAKIAEKEAAQERAKAAPATEQAATVETDVKRLEPKEKQGTTPPVPLPQAIPPDYKRNTRSANPHPRTPPKNGPPPREDDPKMSVDPDEPDPKKMRPRPIPCDAVGLALSGGGIRSAAFSLGALQALDSHGVLSRTDYLSTVSGGGYAGASLTAGMSEQTGAFPFGGARDFHDNDVLGHLRNYSNYLMPRARSGLANTLDVTAILLRGLLANALIVLTFIVAGALLTATAYPAWQDLANGNFLPKLIVAVPQLVAFAAPGWLAGLLQALVDGLVAALTRILGAVDGIFPEPVVEYLGPFRFTAALALAVAAALVLWALKRSKLPDGGNDVDSLSLKWARWLLGFTILSLLLDFQPLMIEGLGRLHVALGQSAGIVSLLQNILSPAAIAAAVAVAFFAQRLGQFLETTELSNRGFVRFQRILAKAILIAAGLVLPLVLFAVYWLFSTWLISGNPVGTPFEAGLPWMWTIAGWTFVILAGMAWAFEANAYSLHQFYKDRLSKAFLFDPRFSAPDDPPQLHDFKLSHIRMEDCPYPVINAALNVQGSTEANRRGRNAEFFTFTPDFVGSELTHFAATVLTTPNAGMEAVESKLDLGAAMAISGAAVSANMGSNTVRWLSPTLALLNIRLGYWLRNPRDLAKLKTRVGRRGRLSKILSKFYLLLEMFNLIDENSRYIFLSDGGHIENLGVYELLKRGCRLIIVIDAEADPEISCASLLKLERYARIDLGVRVVLPWEQIADRNRRTSTALAQRPPELVARDRGPHCAIGPIIYEDGSRGTMLYFKSSLSGDEKDYILDYKKRNPDFPHETTSDQFFTEEQFENYRWLGYHVIDGFFSEPGDDVSWQKDGPWCWGSREAAKADVYRALRMAVPAQTEG